MCCRHLAGWSGSYIWHLRLQSIHASSLSARKRATTLRHGPSPAARFFPSALSRFPVSSCRHHDIFSPLSLAFSALGALHGDKISGKSLFEPPNPSVVTLPVLLIILLPSDCLVAKRFHSRLTHLQGKGGSDARSIAAHASTTNHQLCRSPIRTSPLP